jgi:CheY-like chemotaxis protein
LKLIAEIGKGVPDQVYGDLGRVRQVLMNLVSNAIKFTEAGMVVIDLALSTEKLGKKNQKSILFSVRDSGIGINEKSIHNLFKPFSQVDGSLSRKYGGTGLGLAISKYIVSAMGGMIGVESEPKKGSKFWYIVPFFTENPVSQKKKIKTKGQAKVGSASPDSIREGKEKVKVKLLQNHHVLVVEDNPVNQLVIQKQLESLGLKVTVVSSGTLAIEIINKELFSVIFMDCQMPEMDGFETTKIIREVLKKKGIYIPIIAVTAHALPGEKRRCLDVGMDNYISKPIDFNLLESMVHDLFGDRKEGR